MKVRMEVLGKKNWIEPINTNQILYLTICWCSCWLIERLIDIFRNEITNIGYPTNGEVEIVAGIRECSLHIANASSEENHSGRWTCFLSKSNKNSFLWKENTNYFVNFFTPAKMKISILTSNLESALEKNKYGSVVRKNNVWRVSI